MSKWRDFIKERTGSLLQSDGVYAFAETAEDGAETQTQVSAAPTTATAKIVVLDHIGREDATRIADYIGGSRMAVLDFADTPGEDRIRILDFLSGYMYCQQGRLARINSHAYIAVPSHVDLYGAAEEDESLFSQLTTAFGGDASQGAGQ